MVESLQIQVHQSFCLVRKDIHQSVSVNKQFSIRKSRIAVITGQMRQKCFYQSNCDIISRPTNQIQNKKNQSRQPRQNDSTVE